MFGIMVAVAGVIGCTFGAALSYWLRPKIRIVDPFICGGGVGLGWLMSLIAINQAYDNMWTTYTLSFFGQLLLCFEASVTVDLQLVKFIHLLH